jgi:transposase InsO family protein
LPEEKDAVFELALDETYADLSHRSLALLAMEKNLFFMGFSSVYRVLKERGLTTARTDNARNASSLPPERKEIDGPNQRWCWDISYLRTFEKGIFVYLYVLLDEYSRKVIAWRVSWRATAAEAHELIHEAMWAEKVFDIDITARPEVFNDRGTQMKAKSVRRLFEDHHMPQIFTRPRTPNDNPYIESAFSTIKRAPEYPGAFRDVQEAENYFAVYFPWYNQEHYHSGIDYVTPEQAHQGLREVIVEKRKQQLKAQRQRRRRINQSKDQKKLTPEGNLTKITTNMAGNQ